MSILQMYLLVYVQSGQMTSVEEEGLTPGRHNVHRRCHFLYDSIPAETQNGCRSSVRFIYAKSPDGSPASGVCASVFTSVFI